MGTSGGLVTTERCEIRKQKVEDEFDELWRKVNGMDKEIETVKGRIDVAVLSVKNWVLVSLLILILSNLGMVTYLYFQSGRLVERVEGLIAEKKSASTSAAVHVPRSMVEKELKGE